MAFEVDRVVICDAYKEPDRHYEILSGGKSKLVLCRRPSKSYEVAGKAARKGIASIVGDQPTLFDDQVPANERMNEFVNQLRDEVRGWREAGYPGTALVTRRLLEWWFEREEERAALGRRFFFCQREAIEIVVYLYEVQRRRRMPETGDLIRYALKLATGTGKTVVMALLVTWSALHKRKVSGSPLSANFLVLVPNLTVRDRVGGFTRGDGLDPGGEHNLFAAFEMVPPEYREDFHPNVLVRNWQGIPLEGRREDWLPETVVEEGRFIPAAVLRAMQRRVQQDPNTVIRRVLGGWRDLVIINDEAHHVYGEKRARQGEDPEYIKWSRILDRISRATRVGLVIDLSATPWYGSGAPKPDGTLFEWLVSDFSVYDAFESGLVKVVRLPDPTDKGYIYLDLWDYVKDAKTEQEYVEACKGAIESIYAAWRKDFVEWESLFEFARGPSPVLLCVADNAKRAGWLFNHLQRQCNLFHNEDTEDRTKWVTLQIDSKVFDADKGSEAVIREMVNTVGRKGKPGERVRCIVSVNMLSEGWDVQSVSHILGLRAFGSPLLTEQIIGRGLRRTSYDVLNQPLAERPEGSDETVDALGIPFVGFPVQKRKRAKTGTWGQKPVTIEPDQKKAKFTVNVPNVRAWAVGVSRPLRDVVRVSELPKVIIDPSVTPPTFRMRPVVGDLPENVLTLEEFRREWPLLRSIFLIANELCDRTNPGQAATLGIGPTFEELLEVTQAYVENRVDKKNESKVQDLGIPVWRNRVLDILENAVRAAGESGVKPIPIPGTPVTLDSTHLRPFQWTGILAEGKKCHSNRVPCHTDLEKQFADFLDGAPDVLRYFKNERFGFSVTYYEASRPRQYFPDFIVAVRGADGREVMWLAETKGEIRPNTALKRQATEQWCQRMSATHHGPWQHLFLPQRRFEAAMASGVTTFAQLAAAIVERADRAQLRLVSSEDHRVKQEAFKTLLPLYSLKAAAGYFGNGEEVAPEGWVEVNELGRLDKDMFVARAVGRSMEPTIHDGDFLVFRYNPSGSREGKIVLAQYRGPTDSETGGSFTVKKYSSEKSPDAETEWKHTRITLSPLNREYKPMTIREEEAEDFRIVAEFVGVLGKR